MRIIRLPPNTEGLQPYPKGIRQNWVWSKFHDDQPALKMDTGHEPFILVGVERVMFYKISGHYIKSFKNFWVIAPIGEDYLVMNFASNFLGF